MSERAAAAERVTRRLSRLPPESLGTPLSGLGLSTRAYHCVAPFGTVGELLQAAEYDLMARRNFGKACLADVRRRLAQFALDALGLPHDHPMRLTCAEEHPAVCAVWNAPAQPRTVAEILDEILELLARGDQLLATGAARYGARGSRFPVAINFEQATLKELSDYVFAPLRPREREILEQRFGRDDAAAPSLAQLGECYQLSRERIRQIIDAALGRLRREAEQHRRRPLTEYLAGCFTEAGGVLDEAAVRRALERRYRGAAALRRCLARVVLSATARFQHVHGEIWCLGDCHPAEEVRRTLDELHSLLRRSGRLLTAKQITVLYRQTVERRHAGEFVAACLFADSRFQQYGDRLGLREWEWGVPKSLEEFLRACLLARGRPQTTASLTEYTNSLLPPEAPVTPEDVGAALSACAAFVRLRSGAYALAEWPREQIQTRARVEVREIEKPAVP